MNILEPYFLQYPAFNQYIYNTLDDKCELQWNLHYYSPTIYPHPRGITQELHCKTYSIYDVPIMVQSANQVYKDILKTNGAF